MKTFHQLLVNTLIAGVVNNFLWFGLVFWAYLETQSVMATSIIGGSYMLFSALFGMVFGTFVDRHKKRTVMLYSSIFTFVMFGLASLLYVIWPQTDLLRLGGPHFWTFIVVILAGAVAGNARMIALSTVVTMLVPEGKRDKANGMVGTVNGISFSLTSVFSGLAIGQLGMGWTLVLSVIFTALAIVHLQSIKMREKAVDDSEETPKHLDFRGTIMTINAVPGLMALLFFATFNNFLGGVYMSLMDPYGLNLVSVEVWGLIWGFLSLGFIAGGIIVAKRGLGSNPLKTLLLANVAMWSLSIIFPIKSAIVPLVICMFIYMCLIPAVEASEQTIIQKVVPFKKQGRVFGFGQTIEMLASPITSFLIGPIAQLWIIPFMTDGWGAQRIGSWFGTGTTRGMALIFITAGIIGMAVTFLAFASRAYSTLSSYYKDGPVKPDSGALPTTPLT